MYDQTAVAAASDAQFLFSCVASGVCSAGERAGGVAKSSPMGAKGRGILCGAQLQSTTKRLAGAHAAL